jgi:hypothetical protein
MKRQLTLHARSSSGEPYSVYFVATPEGISIFCNCKAGVNRQLCKHLRGLSEGDVSLLFDGTQAEELAEAARWCEESGILDLFQELDRALSGIAAAKKDLDRRAAELKREVMDIIHSGVGSVEYEEEK